MQHFGESPLPAYEPVFDWENERSMIFGQRIPEAHMSQYTRFYNYFSTFIYLHFSCFEVSFLFGIYFCGYSGLKIAVKVLSLSFQAGLAGGSVILIVNTIISLSSTFHHYLFIYLLHFQATTISFSEFLKFSCRAVLWDNLFI